MDQPACVVEAPECRAQPAEPRLILEHPRTGEQGGRHPRERGAAERAAADIHAAVHRDIEAQARSGPEFEQAHATRGAVVRDDEADAAELRDVTDMPGERVPVPIATEKLHHESVTPSCGVRRGSDLGEQAERQARTGLGATMGDVAALAGVTKMTVSRVLRHPDRVHPDTRHRVAEAIARLGYIPNRVAGGLTAGRSGLVAAIVPTLRHSLFAETLEGVADVLAAAGLGLIVTASSYRTDIEEAQIRAVLERRPDALVLTGLTHTKRARLLLRSVGIPVVETWESSDMPVDLAVGFSNRDAAEAMTRSLIQCGYRRIAFVNGPSQMNERARHRADGYRAAMTQGGLAPLPIHVVSDDASIRPEAGAQALAALLEAHPALDAVFFTSDVYAVGAVLFCHEHAIAVPEQLGIAGFHDLEIGRVVRPSLTTVRVPALEIGRASGELILSRLAGQPVASHPRELPFQIIQRESTRPVKSNSLDAP